MLPSENRLKQKSDFERVKRKGTLFNKGPVGLAVYKRGDSKATRVGIVVSLKVSKKAVERNKIKRRLRDIARNTTPFLHTGYDYIFITKKNIAQAPFTAVKESVIRALQKAR